MLLAPRQGSCADMSDVQFEACARVRACESHISVLCCKLRHTMERHVFSCIEVYELNPTLVAHLTREQRVAVTYKSA